MFFYTIMFLRKRKNTFEIKRQKIKYLNNFTEQCAILCVLVNEQYGIKWTTTA